MAQEAANGNQPSLVVCSDEQRTSWEIHLEYRQEAPFETQSANFSLDNALSRGQGPMEERLMLLNRVAEVHGGFMSVQSAGGAYEGYNGFGKKFGQLKEKLTELSTKTENLSTEMGSHFSVFFEGKFRFEVERSG